MAKKHNEKQSSANDNEEGLALNEMQGLLFAILFGLSIRQNRVIYAIIIFDQSLCTLILSLYAYGIGLALKKSLKRLVLAGGSFACLVLYLVTMLPQDITLFKYKRMFGEINHPANTKSIEIRSFLGALDKTRVMYKEDFPQGCDYQVSEIREYRGAKEDIEAFYALQKINLDGQDKPIGVLFIPISAEGMINPLGLTKAEETKWGPEGYAILDELYRDQEFKFLKLDPSSSYYLISVSGFSLSDFDIRCQF